MIWFVSIGYEMKIPILQLGWQNSCKLKWCEKIFQVGPAYYGNLTKVIATYYFENELNAYLGVNLQHSSLGCPVWAAACLCPFQVEVILRYCTPLLPAPCAQTLRAQYRTFLNCLLMSPVKSENAYIFASLFRRLCICQIISANSQVIIPVEM